ncbi:MAG: hypothetical protein M1301_05660 [Candidatus Thermoplasmatota archaeon]|jgi:uncharacterized membrane protein|nr:hypothetical protein [Candidatus Thermoplasmatota archaeon]
MESKIIKKLQDRVILVVLTIVAFALTGVSSFGSTFHQYMVGGVVEYRFYATSITYTLMYISLVFLLLVIITLVIFLKELRIAKKEGALT